MKLFKKLVALTLLCPFLFVATACGGPKEEVAQVVVDTGDVINIVCDTSTGFELPQSMPFELRNGDAVMAEGSFIDLETYDFYRDVLVAGSLEGLTMLDSGDADGNEYYFYEVNSDDITEWDCIIKIADSNTAVIMGSLDSYENVEDAFHAYRFEFAGVADEQSAEDEDSPEMALDLTEDGAPVDDGQPANDAGTEAGVVTEVENGANAGADEVPAEE